MRDLAILTFQTLDGVMQAPKVPEDDFSGGFEHGGWADPYWDEVMAQVGNHAMAEPYDLLLGRKTYEIFAGHHFQSDDDAPEDSVLNKARKYVATNSLTDLSWANSIAISGDIAKEVADLKQQSGPLLQVHGSWQLIQLLLAHDLIDEFRLWSFPLVVGSGKKLFGAESIPAHLALIKSEACVNGVVMNFYRKKPS